jgi:ABC-2 type transport system ATP-binding protein
MLELSADDMLALQSALQEFEFVSEVVADGKLWLVKMKRETKPSVLNKLLAQKGIYLTHLAQRHKSLEKHFLELVADNHA